MRRTHRPPVLSAYCAAAMLCTAFVSTCPCARRRIAESVRDTSAQRTALKLQSTAQHTHACAVRGVMLLGRATQVSRIARKPKPRDLLVLGTFVVINDESYTSVTCRLRAMVSHPPPQTRISRCGPPAHSPLQSAIRSRADSGPPAVCRRDLRRHPRTPSAWVHRRAIFLLPRYPRPPVERRGAQRMFGVWHHMVGSLSRAPSCG